MQKLGKPVTQLALEAHLSLPIPGNFLNTNPFFSFMSQLLQSSCIGSAMKVISQGHFPSFSLKEGLALVQRPVASCLPSWPDCRLQAGFALQRAHTPAKSHSLPTLNQPSSETNPF